MEQLDAWILEYDRGQVQNVDRLALDYIVIDYMSMCYE
jgi:hypothetical protein